MEHKASGRCGGVNGCDQANVPMNVFEAFEGTSSTNTNPVI
jgi:hypothetical protein